MPTQSNVETTILNAEYKLATLVNNNLALINMGGLAIKEQFLTYFNLNLKGLIYLNNQANYVSTTTNTIYDRLNGFIGIPQGAVIDPSFQNSGITIIIQNPIGYLSPMDIPWTAFSTDGESGDGGRNTYYNTALAGINPFMQDQTTTLLYLSTDYNLIPSGGFVLAGGGNLPYIYEGQSLRAYAYQFVNGAPVPSDREPRIFPDISGATFLTRSYLNATYLYPDFQTADIITLADYNLQYLKMDNTSNALWNEQPLNYAP